MTRLPRLTRDTLEGEQAALFDRIAGTERPDQRPRLPRVGPDGALEGPFNALLRNPGLGTLLQDLGDEVRYRITLTDRCREIAILTVAAAWHSEYERYAHEDIARAVGLTDAEVAAVEAGSTEPFTDETELLIARTARALARAHDLADDEYAAAVAGLGERGLFELVTLVGYYSQIALALRVFRVTPPE
ncbi:MAG TPA: carboxymuconolactone decarboxylase family protein [Streptomyces sp.]|jgi:4-carboxymuconolactone decarboxylase|nr:carboxymuconolactone decarboxylase family protein [Streptomyces sp.]